MLLWVLGFLFIGAMKFDGSWGGYLHYLNNKDWNTSLAQVKFWDPVSYGVLFWDNSVATGQVLTGIVVDELPIDLSGSDT
ncbi:MAG: hypothetical protein GXP45_08455 [bacterium]|nr:hypothetical protein [bacterium]